MAKETNTKKNILYVIVPCYNEEEVLEITSKIFIEKITTLIDKKIIDTKSKVVFVNDGSKDKTWEIIQELSKNNNCVEGLCLSRNRGHQNAVLAGLLECRDSCDISVSIDCDGQDDINAIDRMIEEYDKGFEIVYGVRSKRETDTFFKRFTAESFYKLLASMGVEVIFNHADYRLLSSKVLNYLSNYKEVNLFLRGLIPLIGFKSTTVEYERKERIAGESHYPLKKMLALAFDGITSLSIKPIRLIGAFGVLVTLTSIVFLIITLCFCKSNYFVYFILTEIICFLIGVLFISLSVIGEYVGKNYLETKERPRYIIEKRTFDNECNKK